MTRIVHPGELTCREIVSLITGYLEGVLPEERARRFEIHMGACDACKEYVAQMRKTIATLGHLVERQPPDDVVAAFRTALRGWKSHGP